MTLSSQSQYAASSIHRDSMMGPVSVGTNSTLRGGDNHKLRRLYELTEEEKVAASLGQNRALINN